jgi:hypothetical protein
MWRQLKRLARRLGGQTPAQEAGSEADVQADPAQVGGAHTGSVGRITGEDDGDAGQTGAERRAH